jgi:hypothetical protein
MCFTRIHHILFISEDRGCMVGDSLERRSRTSSRSVFDPYANDPSGREVFLTIQAITTIFF